MYHGYERDPNMKHLALNEGYIRVLDSYIIPVGCVLDVVRNVY